MSIEQEALVIFQRVCTHECETIASTIRELTIKTTDNMMNKAEQVTGYMYLNPANIPDYNERNDYFITNVVGDCMKHPDSPVNVGTGGKVLAHTIDLYWDFLNHWQRYVGKGIVFDIGRGQAEPLRMIKEFVRCDLGVRLVFKCYETDRPIYVPVGMVTGIALVDKVLN